MSEVKAPWEELCISNEVKIVKIKTNSGAEFEFGLKMPTWAKLDDTRNDCILIDKTTGEVASLLQSKWKQNKLRLFVVQTPFPPDQQIKQMERLSPHIVSQLSVVMEEMIKGHKDIIKK